MRNHIGKAIVILAILNLFSTNVLSSQILFISGTVKWDTGSPAVGFEVRLVKDGVIKATTYTNQAGRYGFFEIVGKPPEYTLMVFSKDRMLKEVPMPNVPVGGQVAEIKIGTGTNTPIIFVTPPFNNFHHVEVLESETADFRIKNYGKANLYINSVATTGQDAPMFIVKWEGSHKHKIEPEKSLTINVTFKPTSKGPKSAKLEITSNDPNTPKVEIPLSGIGK